MLSRTVTSLVVAGLVLWMSGSDASAGWKLKKHGKAGCSTCQSHSVDHLPHSATPYWGHGVGTCCGTFSGGGLSGVSGYAGIHSSQSFLSGYEGLPDMNGGGVHYRYPYHSYRRPWFHPGPPSTNITIVW